MFGPVLAVSIDAPRCVLCLGRILQLGARRFICLFLATNLSTSWATCHHLAVLCVLPNSIWVPWSHVKKIQNNNYTVYKNILKFVFMLMLWVSNVQYMGFMGGHSICRMFLGHLHAKWCKKIILYIFFHIIMASCGILALDTIQLKFRNYYHIIVIKIVWLTNLNFKLFITWYWNHMIGYFEFRNQTWFWRYVIGEFDCIVKAKELNRSRSVLFLPVDMINEYRLP